MSKHRFPYRWNIADGYPSSNGKKVFSCFACGGGSTMGYKLAGYEVLGCNEIDPEMIGAYKANHNPKFAFLGPIQEFKKRESFPDELMDLDILDGSPPCSSFSMAGSRESKWGVKKKFREGQAEQVLDNLFFDFLDLAERLQPKVIVAENVKGMLMGNAKAYVKKIQRRFNEIGYAVQLFLLNSATMGVPQKRERVFFVANRMGYDTLKLSFNEDPIPMREISCSGGKLITGKNLERWRSTKAGCFPKTKSGNTFGFMSKEHPDKVCSTVTAGPRNYHWDVPRLLNSEELKCVGTYPQDYKFPKCGEQYLIGMSVPPVMTAQVSVNILDQWLSK